MKNNKGQQMVEYLILMTAIIVIFIVFLRQGGPFYKAVNGTLDASVNFVETMASNISFNGVF